MDWSSASWAAGDPLSLLLDLRHDHPLLEFAAVIPVGQITALVGTSGSGKTSILRTIAGLLRVKHARISLAGEIWDDAMTHRLTRERPIGLVAPSLWHVPTPERAGKQGNRPDPPAHLPASERRARALDCLCLAHFEGLEGRRPHELSGGQRQRVALARAIARSS